MKHTIFRYIAIAATLLATAVNAGAQYNYKNGVATSKKVDQLDAESYKIRLETFATGSTTVSFRKVLLRLKRRHLPIMISPIAIILIFMKIPMGIVGKSMHVKMVTIMTCIIIPVIPKELVHSEMIPILR